MTSSVCFAPGYGYIQNKAIGSSHRISPHGRNFYLLLVPHKSGRRLEYVQIKDRLCSRKILPQANIERIRDIGFTGDHCYGINSVIATDEYCPIAMKGLCNNCDLLLTKNLLAPHH